MSLMGSNNNKVIFQVKSLSCPAEAPSLDESPSPRASVTCPLPLISLPLITYYFPTPHESCLPCSLPTTAQVWITVLTLYWSADKNCSITVKSSEKASGQILPILAVALEWRWSGGEVWMEWGRVQEDEGRERWGRVRWSGGWSGMEWEVGDCWWDIGSKWIIQAFLRMHTDKRYTFLS